jgi:hypothetical protein
VTEQGITFPRFSLRTTLLIVSAFALYLGLRGGYVLADRYLPTIIWRAQIVPPVFAALAVLYVCVFASKNATPQSRLVRSAVYLAAPVAAIVAFAETIEFAFGFWFFYPEYWDWRYDWIYIVGMVLLHAATAIIIGVVIAGIWEQTVRRRFR